jgi:hypothetical protein
METSLNNFMDKIKTRDIETPANVSGLEIESSQNGPRQIREMNIQEMNPKINSSCENDESMTHLN